MPQAYQEQAVGETKHPAMPVGIRVRRRAGCLGTRMRKPTSDCDPRAQTMLNRSYSYNDSVNYPRGEMAALEARPGV
jgi:hypothetical protein